MHGYPMLMIGHVTEYVDYQHEIGHVMEYGYHMYMIGHVTTCGSHRCMIDYAMKHSHYTHAIREATRASMHMY